MPAGLMTALRFTPYLSIVAAAFVPFAAAIYIAVSAVWGALERTVLARRFA
ncbi:hypothetical protein L3i23_07380 [Herbiconiux sp. L3-i23]|nr:hypothetical protein L3i23_07380 [Herbiconiux sp. L3-i23]